MQRLFVAIRPPAPIRALLLNAMGGVSGARWQSEDQLHATLRFIGEADRHLARDLHAALGAIHQPAFEIRLAGVGTFEKNGRLDSLWAGLAPQESMLALHRKVDQALTRVGVEPDRRAFVPHITLARLKRSSGPVGHALAQAGALASPLFAVTEFALYESVLAPDGAVYTPIASYSLAESSRSTIGA